MRSALLAILCGSTALASSIAFAQAPTTTNPPAANQPAATSAAANQTPTLADCDRLVTFLNERHPANPGVTVEQARTYKTDNNPKACHDALVRIDPAYAQATNQGGKEGATNIVVQQPAPDVRVQQASPQVTVQQAQPQVTVRQPQPEITVRQPAPTITVDIPQPEITVRMPRPEVNVAMAQPQVQVNQPPPQVQVVQPQQQPQVQVQPAQPQVSVQQSASSTPNVQVQENGQPKVNYERAEPKVVVNQPKGQPQVRFEQDQGQRPEGQQTAAAPANRQANATSGTAAAPPAARSAAPAGAAATQPIAVARLKGMELYNEHGDRLGDVERVVQSNDGKQSVVIGMGGFLGLGEKRIAVPVDDVAIRGGRLVAVGLTDDQLKRMPTWEANSREFRDVDGNATVQLSQR
jgi:sporulation protein YlmC with PRC-barrel domain